jgi:hypothetical protein
MPGSKPRLKQMRSEKKVPHRESFECGMPDWGKDRTDDE